MNRYPSVLFLFLVASLLSLTTALAGELASQQDWNVKMLREGDCFDEGESISVNAFLHPSRHGARISDHRSWRARGLSASTAELSEDDSAKRLVRFMFNPQEYRKKTLFALFRGRLLCDASGSRGRVFQIESVSNIRIEAL